MAGKVVGGYELLSELYRGSFGVAYTARAQNGQNCTIQKIAGVKPSTRLERTIRQMKSLQSNHILHVWDFFFHPSKSRLYVVMQDCKNGTLQDNLPIDRPEDKKLIMSSITKGLVYLHEKDIIHGNLSPQCIYLTVNKSRTECKIGNFIEGQLGLKKHNQESLYQAPEVQEWREIMCATDVFSLGLIFLAILAGCDWVEERDTIMWLLRSGSTPESSLEQLIPGKYMKMLLKMLQWEPEARIDAFEIDRKHLGGKDILYAEHDDEILDPHTESSGVQYDASVVKTEKESKIRTKWYLLEERLRSFDKWPQEERLRHLTPHRMVEAGFFCTGKGDEVRCAVCSVRLAKWEVDDDPWQEHSKASSQCALVRQKGNWTRGKGIEVKKGPSGAIYKEPSYEVIDFIAGGGFGQIHKIKMHTGEIVARKRIKVDETHPEHALKEMKIVHELLPHPNIVSMHDAFLTQRKKGNSLPFVSIFMEFSAEGDLNDYMVANQPRMRTSLGFMIDIAEGVEHLHRSGIMHRDLKPNNILVFQCDERMYGKITDFNVSNFYTHNKLLYSHMPRHPYQAPEIDDRGAYTISRDVFSVGAMYFAMAALNIEDDYLRPFVGRQAIGTVVLRKPNIYKEIKSYFHGFDDIAKLTAYMLEEDAEKRPKMKRVASDMRKYCKPVDVEPIKL